MVARTRIRLVQEFKDVFRALQDVPPAGADPSMIELEPGTVPMSKSPYRLAPAEMAEMRSTKSSEGQGSQHNQVGD